MCTEFKMPTQLKKFTLTNLDVAIFGSFLFSVCFIRVFSKWGENSGGEKTNYFLVSLYFYYYYTAVILYGTVFVGM